MQPFRVSCETCHSRLKVRSAEAIGEIHACPKCGSMVLIAPPAGWVPGTAEDAEAPASRALHQELGGPTESPLSLSTTASTIVPADFSLDLSAEPVEAAPAATRLVETLPANISPANISPASVSPASVSPAEVSPAGMTPALWCLVGGAALFVTVGLAYALWPSQDGKAPPPSATAAANDPPTADSSDPRPAEAHTPSAPPSLPSPQAEPSAPSDLAGQPMRGVEPNRADPQATIAAESPGHRVEATPVGPSEAVPIPQESSENRELAKTTDANAPGATTTAAVRVNDRAVSTNHLQQLPEKQQQDANVGEAALAVKPVLQFDPLDFDPERLSLATESSRAPAAGSAAVNEAAAGPAAGVSASAESGSEKEFTKGSASVGGTAANPAGGEVAIEGEKDPPAVPAAVGPPPAIVVQRGPVVPDNMQPLDTAQHLSLQVQSLQVPEVSLAKFASMMGDLAGVPITLDPQVLELNGQTARTTISIGLEKATLDQVLRQALASRRLELVDRDGQLSIGLAGAEERKDVDFEVSDLVEGDADASAIAKLIEQFVAPTTWKPAGGEGTMVVEGKALHVNNSLTARREALIFCERLRLARGRVQRSKYPAELLRMDSAQIRLREKLSQPTTFTFLAWARFGDVVRQWEEMSGLTILVDWSALSEEDMSPATPVACAANNRPWGESLDGILAPLDLGWRGVDEQAIAISSQRAMNRIDQVEFHNLPTAAGTGPANAESWIAKLQKEIAESGGESSPESEPLFYFDRPSSRLIVRATPAVQRMIRQRLASQ
ncbi:MAG: hypothetical protein IT425_06290 [Pirellulales bacterium]|nr:hypothetical protein [Pirellulales bacterium]